jgi:type I restriction enzyme, S subunit
MNVWQDYRIKDLKANINSAFVDGPFGSNLKTEHFVEGGDVYVIDSGFITSGDFFMHREFRTITKEHFQTVKRSQCKLNDIIIAKIGANFGMSAILPQLDKPSLVSGNTLKLTINHKKYDLKFIHYVFLYLKESGQIDILVKGSAQPALSMGLMNDLIFSVPNKFEEQIAIAQYLNTKTQAIDKKINLLTKKAEAYKELRRSIINDAVCKGLDKNVKLKESEFIFPVNTNWKRYRLKDLGFLYSGLSGKAGDDFNQDDNPNNKGFIPFTNIANNTYLKANHLGTVALGENEKQNKVRKGDLFFLMSSEGYEDVGKTAALAEDIKDTYLNSFCKGYRITKKFCEPFFLNYLLLSDNYRKSLLTEGKGFTRINLKMEKVTDFFVYLPSTKEEQTAIANYLDEKTQKIDAIVSNIGKQIDTLKELRKTLINDVVTGKIKVVNN